MTGGQQVSSLTQNTKTADVHVAWERFVEGEDVVRGVRPEVVVSWQRSRDQYRVDPYLAEAPVAMSRGGHPLDHDVVFAELGFRAAALAHEVANVGGIVVIADAHGRILAEWGDKETSAVAAEAGLAPWFCWSESAVGTNGMGTALATQTGVVMVRREEHWRQALHDWSCVGVAVRDVVSQQPIAALNISCWRSDLPRSAGAWLGNAAASTQRRLRTRARDGGAEMLAAYNQARAQSTAPCAALDTAGKVIIADERASVLLGVPSNTPAVEPAVRWTPQLPELMHAARYATEQATRSVDWVGSTQIYTHLADEPSSIGIRPVHLYGGLVGHLISFAPSDGEQLPQHEGESHPNLQSQQSLSSRPRRVVGMREQRMVMLHESEVALAEADGNDVWLSTDQGRMRAAIPGLDKLGQELTQAGFVRAHRRYIVNLSRVREVERREKGELVLVMDDKARTQVPVSRRNARTVRLALGI